MAEEQTKITYVYVQGQISPGALGTLHARLSAQDTLRANLERDTSDLRCEGTQLVHHGIYCGLQRRHFPFDLNLDLTRQVSLCNRSRDRGDRPYLIR